MVVDAVRLVGQVLSVLLVDVHVQVELELVDLVENDLVHTGVDEEHAGFDTEGLLVQLPGVVSLLVPPVAVQHSDGHGVVLGLRKESLLSGQAMSGTPAESASPAGTEKCRYSLSCLSSRPR